MTPSDRPPDHRADSRGGGSVGRVGTARALVLLAAVLAGGAALLVCLAALLLGPALLDRADLTGTLAIAGVTFVLIVGLFAAVASVLAARARTVGTVVVRGCGLLLAGILAGLVTMLLLISRSG